MAIDQALLRRLRICPRPDATTLVGADAKPWSLPMASHFFPDRPLELASTSALEAALSERPNESAASVISQAKNDLSLTSLLHAADNGQSHSADPDAPIIRMVNAILTEALTRKASDIHLEPYEDRCQVRLRIDGMLADLAEPPRGVYAALISRIKIMASLDIAERRLPQDGRLTVRVGSQGIDCRVSTLPTAHGERAVLRLLQKAAAQTALSELGMSAPVKAQFESLLDRPNGILLVTGPTGSGKTTTLYAALSALRTSHENIMTVEDPIEVEMPGISQTAVAPKIGLTFASALRAILRQDPDILMIGEIRDLETAQIAVQAALTGHLVLATLHTNDAASAVTRLLDMGIEPFLLSSTLRGVLAQRLVRRLCPSCRSSGHASSMGCPSCNQTGYSGRTGIYELLEVNEAMANAIKAGSDGPGLRRLGIGNGLVPLQDDARRWIEQGETSLEEIHRVLSSGESLEEAR